MVLCGSCTYLSNIYLNLHIKSFLGDWEVPASKLKLRVPQIAISKRYSKLGMWYVWAKFTSSSYFFFHLKLDLGLILRPLWYKQSKGKMKTTAWNMKILENNAFYASILTLWDKNCRWSYKGKPCVRVRLTAAKFVLTVANEVYLQSPCRAALCTNSPKCNKIIFMFSMY